MKLYSERIILNYQCGFRTVSSTSEQIHALTQFGGAVEFNFSTFHLYIDFKTPYDSVKITTLFKPMEEFGMPVKLVRLT
jgi:hypothetical protein